MAKAAGEAEDAAGEDAEGQALSPDRGLPEFLVVFPTAGGLRGGMATLNSKNCKQVLNFCQTAIFSGTDSFVTPKQQFSDFGRNIITAWPPTHQVRVADSTLWIGSAILSSLVHSRARGCRAET